MSWASTRRHSTHFLCRHRDAQPPHRRGPISLNAPERQTSSPSAQARPHPRRAGHTRQAPEGARGEARPHHQGAHEDGTLLRVEFEFACGGVYCAVVDVRYRRCRQDVRVTQSVRSHTTDYAAQRRFPRSPRETSRPVSSIPCWSFLLSFCDLSLAKEKTAEVVGTVCLTCKYCVFL